MTISSCYTLEKITFAESTNFVHKMSLKCKTVSINKSSKVSFPKSKHAITFEKFKKLLL